MDQVGGGNFIRNLSGLEDRTSTCKSLCQRRWEVQIMHIKLGKFFWLSSLVRLVGQDITNLFDILHEDGEPLFMVTGVSYDVLKMCNQISV